MLKPNKIYCWDCLELMKQIPNKSIDLVLTDPPYGIDYNNNKLNRKSNQCHSNIIGDKWINFKYIIQELCRIGKRVIIFWAINFFYDLPYKWLWICRDKRTKKEADWALGSPFELAWCDKPSWYDKIYRIMHWWIVNDDWWKRFHPTQKPVRLMNNILQDFTKKWDTILDPFLWSWTTAIACKELGRKFIGIEIEQKYVDIANERLKTTTMSLF